MQSIRLTSLRSRNEFRFYETPTAFYIEKFGGMSGTYCGEIPYMKKIYQGMTLFDFINIAIDQDLINADYSRFSY